MLRRVPEQETTDGAAQQDQCRRQCQDEFAARTRARFADFCQNARGDGRKPLMGNIRLIVRGIGGMIRRQREIGFRFRIGCSILTTTYT